MIITKTPFRMSFFGGGTDYEEFYNEYGGSVISTTFDKFCYVTVRHMPRFFNYKNQLTYAKIERVNEIDEIGHPAIRNAMKYLDMREIRLVYEADLPARSGIGSSSSFAVGMLNAFYALKGKYVGAEQLAKDAIYLERVLCNEDGGIQDQIAASYGGFNRIEFKTGGFHVSPIVISRERRDELDHNLMLFFTGFSRFSSDIAKEQKKITKSKTKDLLEMKGLVEESEKVLISKNSLSEFGKLLDYSWNLKRGITKKISSDDIDMIYKRAKNAGALGGKLLGAGGGGFMVFYVEQERQKQVLDALSDLLYVPFEFEDIGSEVMYYAPEVFTLQN